MSCRNAWPLTSACRPLITRRCPAAPLGQHIWATISVSASCRVSNPRTYTTSPRDIQRLTPLRACKWRSEAHNPRSFLSRVISGQFSVSQRHDQWLSAPGSEPGIDPTKEESPEWDERHHHTHRDSHVTVIDFSDTDVKQYELDNDSLPGFLQQQPPPDWSSCRWIHINGLSWDVVRCIGNHKGLHRLAMEDVMSLRTPTKVDWYQGHAFMVLTLQKLVSQQQNDSTMRHPLHSLHRRRAEHNEERMRFMETRSVLASRHLAVAVEQVSIFLTSDNTVITMFEESGNDILTPILKRLQAPDTILRSSNDPSMLVQAVLDAIVDLSIPVAKAYSDAFADLEFTVLAHPSLVQPTELYVLRSDLALLASLINPIGSLVNTLHDHQAILSSPFTEDSSTRPKTPPNATAAKKSSVRMSPLAQAYLADVQDHVLMLSTALREAVRSAENLTSLIFNTITARQNESVRQLTIVSIFFLPLTFLTGYFGMNFDPFPAATEHSDSFFWILASPIMAVTLLMFGWRSIRRKLRSLQFRRRLGPRKRI